MPSIEVTDLQFSLYEAGQSITITPPKVEHYVAVRKHNHAEIVAFNVVNGVAQGGGKLLVGNEPGFRLTDTEHFMRTPEQWTCVKVCKDLTI